jgi:pimeloyl-ACP methyl ester carboxylesterase
MRRDAEPQTIVVHGHRVAYRAAGSGPVVVLVHGMARSSDTWTAVLPDLAERYAVVAVDLLGHGQSAKPVADYSLGAHACVLRDLLIALGHERATVVGHSFGGGVAMQFAYQFPEWCERLVLVSSGGLGQEVHPILRAAALPGAEFVLPAVGGAKSTLDGIARLIGRFGFRPSPELEEIGAALLSLADADGRRAFLHTIRSVIDLHGQRVSAVDRLYLTAALPTLLVWGAADRMIPVEHAHEAHAAMAGSRLAVFPDAGHFPHRDDPSGFVDVLRDFIDSTAPASVGEDAWRSMLRAEPVPATA